MGIGSIKELESFLSNPDTLNTFLNNGYSLRDYDQLQSIIDAYNDLSGKRKEIEALNKELNTGLSLDEAKNTFDDFLLSADATFEQVGDSFEDHMRRAILNSVKSNYLNKEMEKWYNSFADYSRNGLNTTDIETLKSQYEEIFTSAQDQIKAALDIAGLSLSSSSQQSSSSGFNAMSQSTGDELNGRFTALQMAGEEIKLDGRERTKQISLLTMTVEDLKNGVTGIRDIVNDSNNIQANMLLHLMDISDNTKAIVQPIVKMQKDMEQVKTNTSRL